MTSQPTDSHEREKATEVLKCPQCGANQRFDAATQDLVCDHCGHSVDMVRNIAVAERDFMLAESDAQNWTGTAVYRCNNCGAKQVVNKTEIAKICPFCGTGNILESGELPGIKPGAVLPFTVSREQCKVTCKEWLRRKFFVPTEFKKRQDFSKLNGVYHPAWTFDSHTDSRYTGRLGKHYTESVGSGKNRHTVTRTRYFDIQGTWNEFFDDVLIEASPLLDTKTVEKLRPFNLKGAAVYDEKYLAGFSALHYDKGINNSFVQAKQVMEKQIEREILNGYDYDVVDFFHCYTKHNRVTFKYVLLPVWMGCFRYRKKDYRYYINGDTGKGYGKVPRSGWKILRFAGILLGIAGALAGICYLLL